MLLVDMGSPILTRGLAISWAGDPELEKTQTAGRALASLHSSRCLPSHYGYDVTNLLGLLLP